MHLILTGATGLVGAACLDVMLSASAVSKISILSRRPVPMAEGKEKANVIIHDDFLNYDSEVLEKLKGATGCVWALGVSQTQVSKEDYVKITKDFTLAAAKAFSTLSPTFNFVFVSGSGATLSPGLFTALFGRVKGETEAALLQAGESNPNFHVYSARPALVDPVDHTEIHPFVPSNNAGNAARKYLGPVIRTAWKNGVSPTKPLGKVLTELALSNGQPLEGVWQEGGGRILENIKLRELGGL